MKTIILDIDRTLVHSLKYRLVKDEWKEKFEWFDDGIDIITFLRPNVREFINFLIDNNSKYKVGIFTAASREYANFVVDILFPQVKPIFVYSGIDYDIAKYNYGKLKAIEYVVDNNVGIKYEDCVMIDDSNAVKRSLGEVCYQIPLFAVCYDNPPGIFYPASVEDKELLKVIEWLKEENK